MPVPDFDYPSPYEDKLDTLKTNFVGFASLTALVWDHIDTFPDEVEFIWKGKKGLFIYLFFFNRYFTPLGFILNLHAYLSPLWTPEASIIFNCARFVKYEGVTVSLAVEVVGLMMLLRIRAIYSNHIWITLFLASLLLLETGVNAWLIAHAGPVIHNPLSDVHACSMVFDSSKPYSRVLASSSAWIPLFYDTIIFLLTLYKTVPPLHRAEASYIIQRLFEDGLLYYSVIVIVTLVLTIMILSAPEGTKNIAAQSEQLITVAMMSRITLNLRKAGHHRHPTPYLGGLRSSIPTHDHHSHQSERDFWLLRIFPGSRRAIQQLWEHGSFFQFTYFGTSSQNQTRTQDVGLETYTGAEANEMNMTVENEADAERGESVLSGRHSLSRSRRDVLGMQFAVTPDSISYDGRDFPYLRS